MSKFQIFHRDNILKQIMWEFVCACMHVRVSA